MRLSQLLNSWAQQWHPKRTRFASPFFLFVKKKVGQFEIQLRHLGCNVTLVVDEFACKLWEALVGSCRACVRLRFDTRCFELSWVRSHSSFFSPPNGWQEFERSVFGISKQMSSFGPCSWNRCRCTLCTRKPTTNKRPKMRKCLPRTLVMIQQWRSPRQGIFRNSSTVIQKSLLFRDDFQGSLYKYNEIHCSFDGIHTVTTAFYKSIFEICCLNWGLYAVCQQKSLDPKRTHNSQLNL